MHGSRAALIVILACLLTGCASSQVLLDRAVIRNETTVTLRDVTVKHEPTGRIGAISVIPPGRLLDLGLPPQPMKAKTASVTWTPRGEPSRTTSLELPKDADAAREQIPMTLVYTIYGSGNVTVTLRPPGWTPE